MFLKPLTKSERLKLLEALRCRILDGNTRTPAITQDLIKQSAGFKGERAVAYYLDFLPEKEYLIFHYLRLPSGKHHFQMDFLILTTRFALILECKNIFGVLYFDNVFKQLVRSANEKEEGFPDPVSQVKWHQKQLQSWMPSLPIETLVIMSNPSAILKANPGDKDNARYVVRNQNLLERIEEISLKHTKELLDYKQLKKLSKNLMKCHEPEKIDILKIYSIPKSDVITGVQCPNCQQFAMIRHQKKWDCEKCVSFSKNAHVKAVEDYLLLINPTITNQQFRKFTHLQSIYTANRLLKSMNLCSIGSNKGRSYTWGVR